VKKSLMMPTMYLKLVKKMKTVTLLQAETQLPKVRITSLLAVT